MAKFNKELIERWEKAEADYTRALTTTGVYTHRYFKTQVYIPVAFIDEKIKEHQEFVDRTGIKVNRDYTREEMRRMIKRDLDKFWVHRSSVKEYSIYENFVTGETRKKMKY